VDEKAHNWMWDQGSQHEKEKTGKVFFFGEQLPGEDTMGLAKYCRGLEVVGKWGGEDL